MVSEYGLNCSLWPVGRLLEHWVVELLSYWVSECELLSYWAIEPLSCRVSDKRRKWKNDMLVILKVHIESIHACGIIQSTSPLGINGKTIGFWEEWPHLVIGLALTLLLGCYCNLWCFECLEWLKLLRLQFSICWWIVVACGFTTKDASTAGMAGKLVQYFYVTRDLCVI